MVEDPLTQVLLLLAAALLVVALARRLGLPAILGYLAVGTALGPFAFGLIDESATTRLLAELGVVFLLFTLGLEFSWPRMVAMRREVFGLGTAQVVLTTSLVAAIAHAAGVAWPQAVVIGGAVSMSSTAIILQQLTEMSELNRTHGRIAFSVLLFQDLAVVPFLVLVGVLSVRGEAFTLERLASTLGLGVLAVGVVVLAGRYLLRPLLYEIAHSRVRELFTLAVLFVALGSAWTSHAAGVSMAAGGFLAGVMLAETEYRHQVEAVIKPFRDILLGLFFITVGMLLDLGMLWREFALIAAFWLALTVLKALLVATIVRAYGLPWFKAVRSAVVLSIGGEFGIALLTILLRDAAPPVSELVQPLFVAIVLSMVTSPFLLRNNRQLARLVLRERGPRAAAAPPESDPTADVARREHVILCGFGRVGQNVARVLESQGFEYIAMDLDPARVRNARQAGDPVVYGDSSDDELLRQVGVENASAVVVTFASPATSVGIIRSVRLLRPDVPILVRTQDDTGLKELTEAGATEVVPETFEASLMLVSHTLMLLNVPVSRVVRTVGAIRSNRYSTLRSLFRREDALPIDETHAYREELKSVVVPPGAWAVGRSIGEVRARGAEVAFTGVRRQGILGREPSPQMRLREGDVVVLYGLPEALEHAEAVLLAG
ncbi:MAG: monovalent cation:proton antiporter-2 (CPA2) family protein [Steroidobacteraceae bacterium]|jgi:CPA2 family monovalent cation:H+ antiporter-2|nr:monovalent cation:proton antiporter-2 (CPA2) family protein [Steroidobacteraceae bacterium]